MTKTLLKRMVDSIPKANELLEEAIKFINTSRNSGLCYRYHSVDSHKKGTFKFFQFT